MLATLWIELVRRWCWWDLRIEWSEIADRLLLLSMEVSPARWWRWCRTMADELEKDDPTLALALVWSAPRSKGSSTLSPREVEVIGKPSELCVAMLLRSDPLR